MFSGYWAENWFIRVFRKFFFASPRIATLVSLLSLISQVCMILSFLLPMKVLILLASDNLPGYFSLIPIEVSRNQLVVILSFSAFLFFVISSLAGKLSDFFIGKGAHALQEISGKLVLFEGYNDFLVDSYGRLSVFCARVLFVVCACIFFTAFYFDLFIIYIFCVSLGIYLLYLKNINHEDFYIVKEVNSLISVFQGLFFFIIFAYLILDFLYFNPPNFIIALIAVIVSRQLISATNSLFRDFFFIKKQKNKIEAVYLQDKAFYSSGTSGGALAWNMLREEKFKNNILPILQKITQTSWREYRFNWLQSGIKDLLFLYAKEQNEDVGYLIKIYPKKHYRKAMHEATLLLEGSKGLGGLPVPELLYATLVSGQHVHVLYVDGAADLNEEYKISPKEFYFSLFCQDVPEDLSSQYKRSHPMSTSLLSEEDLGCLSLALKGKEESLVSCLKENFTYMKSIMEKMPLMFSTPFREDWCVKTKENNFVLIDWSSWRIEQGLSGYPSSESDLLEIEKKIHNLYLARPSLKNVPVSAIQFSVLYHDFYKAMKKQLYMDVLDKLPLLLFYYHLSVQDGFLND